MEAVPFDASASGDRHKAEERPILDAAMSEEEVDALAEELGVDLEEPEPAQDSEVLH